jgi:hypothetical protein
MKLEIALYTILIFFAVLTKVNLFFVYVIYIILLLPLAFFDLKKLGIYEFKRGILWGFLSSSIYFPFVVNGFSFGLLNQVPYVFSEEIFFRGFLLTRFNEKFKNIHLNNIFVSVLFTIPHIILNPSLISVLVFFPSLIFGYLFIYTKSIYAPTIFHYFSNLFFQLYLTRTDTFNFIVNNFN